MIYSTRATRILLLIVAWTFDLISIANYCVIAHKIVEVNCRNNYKYFLLLSWFWSIDIVSLFNSIFNVQSNIKTDINIKYNYII